MKDKDRLAIMNIVWFSSVLVAIVVTKSSLWWMLFPVLFHWTPGDFQDKPK